MKFVIFGRDAKQVIDVVKGVSIWRSLGNLALPIEDIKGNLEFFFFWMNMEFFYYWDFGLVKKSAIFLVHKLDRWA